MFELRVMGHFAAAHRLREFGGKCEGLHGHNWRVEVEVAAAETGPTGVVIDFARLKEELGRVLEELDHKDLSCHEHFARVNPSSEELARFIFDRLKGRVAPATLKLVRVWESEEACAAYCE